MTFINWRELREGAQIDPLVSIGLKSRKNQSEISVLSTSGGFYARLTRVLAAILEVLSL